MGDTDISYFDKYDRTEVDLSTDSEPSKMINKRKIDAVYNIEKSYSASVSESDKSNDDSRDFNLQFVTDYTGTAIRRSEKRDSIEIGKNRNNVRAAQLIAMSSPKGSPSKVVGLDTHSRTGSNKTRELAKSVSSIRTKNSEIKSNIYKQETSEVKLIDQFKQDKDFKKIIASFAKSKREKNIINFIVLAIDIYNKVNSDTFDDIDKRVDYIYNILKCALKHMYDENLLSDDVYLVINERINLDEERTKADIKTSLEIIGDKIKKNKKGGFFSRLFCCCRSN